MFFSYFASFFSYLKVPLEIIPMAIMRPISGTSALAIMTNIFATHGPDSLLGTLASIIQGTTDTTFYVLTIYFGSVGIKKIKHSLFVGLISDLTCIVLSILIVNMIF
jgi:spore maturation protein B